YDQFLQVIREGRPDIKDNLTDVVVEKTITVRGPEANKEREEKFVRTRVDGGIFTADQAKEFGLIDQIGYLDDVIKDVGGQAGLGDHYRAITYERSRSLTERLLGVQSPESAAPLDANRLGAAATPRLWYLAPQSELAGLLTAAGR